MCLYYSLDFKKYAIPIDISSNKKELLVQQLVQWRTAGFALLNGFLPDALINAAKEEIQDLVLSNPNGVTDDFGGFGFPFARSALNDIVLHPEIVALAKEALGGEVHLIQGEAWMKRQTSRTKFSNQDQRMHMDYPNHTMLHPPIWGAPEVISMIIYLDDVEECAGATKISNRKAYKC